jgi:hypothetical protein
MTASDTCGKTGNAKKIAHPRQLPGKVVEILPDAQGMHGIQRVEPKK